MWRLRLENDVFNILAYNMIEKDMNFPAFICV